MPMIENSDHIGVASLHLRFLLVMIKINGLEIEFSGGYGAMLGGCRVNSPR